MRCRARLLSGVAPWTAWKTRKGVTGGRSKVSVQWPCPDRSDRQKCDTSNFTRRTRRRR
jgi:hypothetical protein